MIRLIPLFLWLFLGISQVHSGEDTDFTPFNHRLAGNYDYEGEQKVKFHGDKVAVLDDTSAWKIHPDDRDKFLKWNLGEVIHIGVRTTWFLFKREHKFLLHNHDRKEQVKAFLVRTPFTVLIAEDPQYAAHTIDMWGNAVPSDYRRNLTLNNRSRFQINSLDKDPQFPKGSPVYVGYQEVKGENFLFLISGVGEGAVWRWGIKGNYNYFSN